MNEKISIIVPVYNVEKYLERCVESILNQTYQNIEIILVDDGSKDSSPKICDDYAKKDQRIKVVHKKNGGLSSARNAGLELCTGDYIGFIDSDDWIEPEMYQKLYEVAEKHGADIAACDYHSVFEDKPDALFTQPEEQFEIVSDTKEALRYLLRHEYFHIAVWVRLYKKELFENLKFIEGHVIEDLHITPVLFERAKKLVYTNFKGYFYFIRQNSIMGKEDFKVTSDANFALRELKKFFINNHPELMEDLNHIYISGLLKNYTMLSNLEPCDKVDSLKRGIIDELNQYKLSDTRSHYKILLGIFKLSPKLYVPFTRLVGINRMRKKDTSNKS